MTLKEKFSLILMEFWSSDWESKCEKMADEFTIGFAEWKDNNCIYYDGWNIKIPLRDKYNDVYTNEELLQIYKKEKGLL